MIQVILQNDYHKTELTFPCKEVEITNALLALQYDSESSSGVFVSQVVDPEELKDLIVFRDNNGGVKFSL